MLRTSKWLSTVVLSSGLILGISSSSGLSFGNYACAEETGDDKPAATPVPEDGGGERNGDKQHRSVFEASEVPSAFACKPCHPLQFRQWSASSHAQAYLSPAVRSQENHTKVLTNGTLGDSCVRCHNPVAAMASVSSTVSNMDVPQNLREGVTCIACHRQAKRYGKTSSRFTVQAGDIFADIFGPSDNTVQKEAEQVESLQLVTAPGQRGRAIHNRVVQLPTMRTPNLCANCHSSKMPTGFHNEETFDEYRTSQSARDGVTCQDCHMGKVPGENGGFDFGPAAEIGEYRTRARRQSNHYFAGPDLPILHPGIFPHNPDAVELADYRQWLQFDHAAGWGTDPFENSVPGDHKFPEFWADADLRRDARAILDENSKLMEWAKDQRMRLMQAGYKVQEVVMESADLDDGLRFKIKLHNAVPGHNAPSGFIHERMVFFQISVADSHGKVIFRSGDRDPNGDLRVNFSEYVNNGELPIDAPLFNLQSHFSARSAFGANRQQFRFTAVAATTRPFGRPVTNPASILGYPNDVRTVKNSIEPLGHRWAHYRVDPDKLRAGETYSVNMKLISQQMPNYFLNGMSSVGFDYNLSLREIAARTAETAMVLWERTETVTVTKER